MRVVRYTKHHDVMPSSPGVYEILNEDVKTMLGGDLWARSLAGGAYLYVAVTHALRMTVLDGVQQLAQVENSRVAPKPATKRRVVLSTWEEGRFREDK